MDRIQVIRVSPILTDQLRVQCQAPETLLDPGGFGAVTITKSITIDGGTGSGWASILASSTNGIIINAAATDIVTLRNISIDGGGTGICGIRILSAGTVIVEDCTIFNFKATAGTDAGRGIRDARNNGGRLFVTNTTIRDNALTAIVIESSIGSPRLNAIIDNVRLIGNAEGLSVNSGALVTISNSLISGNATAFGVVAQSPAGSVATTEVNVAGCTISHNSSGVGVANGSPLIRLSDSDVVGNTIGIQLLSGTVRSFGNNRIDGNQLGNTPSAGAPLGLK
jgi:hypothetical protein